MRPVVSLVFPTYNDRDAVGSVIESVRAQSFGEWELLIADDASSDDSFAVLESFQKRDERIRLFRRTVHDRAEAWAQIYAAAQGRYLCLPGADDVLHPTRLAAQVERMDADPSVALCHTDVRHIGDGGKVLETVRLTPPPGGRLVAELLLKNFIYTPTVMVRRDAAESAGGWLRREFGPAADYNLWLRLAQRGRFGHVAEPLTDYRVNRRMQTAANGIPRLLEFITLAHQAFYNDGDIPERRPDGLDEDALVWMYQYVARALTPPTFVTGTGLERGFVGFFKPILEHRGGSARVKAARAEALLTASISTGSGELRARAIEDDPGVAERESLARARHLLARAAERLWLNDVEGARRLTDQARTSWTRDWSARPAFAHESSWTGRSTI